MIKIAEDVKFFLEKEHFVIVSSLSKENIIHTSAKAIIEIQPKGKIFLLDLYKAETYSNIKNNPNVTLTSVNDHSYRGYSIEGRAKIIQEDSIAEKTLKSWHDKISKRIARRLIRHMKEEVSSEKHIPEARFPLPKYVIEVDIQRVIDLAPHRLKAKNRGGG